ncbi:MAG: apolipoprotein N-acyltransferase, partial [Acidobacteria bacterium]|nr:apolipoprotein N-acyltransferase [Acidobacteriota bacterium]
MRRILPPGILVLSGALTALALPQTALWPLILVGLVPLLLVLDWKMPEAPALAGLLWGLGY